MVPQEARVEEADGDDGEDAGGRAELHCEDLQAGRDDAEFRKKQNRKKQNINGEKVQNIARASL